METICATMNYGNLVRGHYYKVLEYGRDYVKVQARGRVVFTPNYVYDPDNLRFVNEMEIEENV